MAGRPYCWAGAGEHNKKPTSVGTSADAARKSACATCATLPLLLGIFTSFGDVVEIIVVRQPFLRPHVHGAIHRNSHRACTLIHPGVRGEDVILDRPQIL